MSILFEPDTDESVDVVFERTEIGSRVLGVREPVVRPVVVRLFSDRSKDSPFRRDCRCHTSIFGVDRGVGGRFECRLWDRQSWHGLARFDENETLSERGHGCRTDVSDDTSILHVRRTRTESGRNEPDWYYSSENDHPGQLDERLRHNNRRDHLVSRWQRKRQR